VDIKKSIPYIVIGILILTGLLFFSKAEKNSGSATNPKQSIDAQTLSDKLARADSLAKDDKILEAHQAYQDLAQKFGSTDIGKQAFLKSNSIGIEAFFESLDDSNRTFYTVRSGDNLTRIAKQFGVTAGLIQMANGLKNDKIFPLQKLQVMTDPWNIVVKKSSNTLQLNVGNRIVRQYDVATGKDNSTPAGEFKIVNRLEDPTWYYAEEGKVEPAGSPKNPLGSRWMGFDLEGYGLHGTTDPDKIGQYATLGCVRMFNHEIEELFNIVPVGTTVSIVE
jgi:lipoprotein-anchoring transpeptidase ErfK/SrfK